MQQENTVVSIIIPAFNQLEFTRNCIESIISNPPEKAYEIIVVDDASTDSTPDFLREQASSNPCIKTLRNEITKGFAGSCNHGAKAAQGQYLLFLNNDTEVCPGWFEPLMAILKDKPEVGIVAPKLTFPDNTIQHCGKVWKDPAEPHSQPQHIYYRLPADHPAVNKSREYRMLTGACILLRRDEFWSVGGFDEGFENGWEDDDLCYAYSANGKKIYYCAESKVVHHQGKTLREKTVRLEKQISSHSTDREDYKDFSSGPVSPETAAGYPHPHSAREQLETELIKVRGRFDRNRSRFFSKWGGAIFRDDYRYYHEDGFSDDGPIKDVRVAARPGAAIIIVTYNSAATIVPCLDSTLLSLGRDDEIVVVDNASRDDTVSIVERYVASDMRITLIRNRENRGFTTATNQGIRASSRALVTLLNPDTVVPSGWINGLATHLNDPAVAAVGPISNYVAGLQKEELYRKGEIPPKITVEEAAAIFRSWNSGTSVDAKLLIGFCLMVRRDVLNIVGLLDENLFLGNDYLELCLRLRTKGYRLLVACDTFVYHEGQKSFASEKRSTTDALIQESTDRLFEKLEAHYGREQVPPPEELWGISWFRPGNKSPEHAAMNADEPSPGDFADQCNPLVSIVILTFNQLDDTKHCLESILRHTSLPHEVILIDNGSSDGSVEWLKEQTRKHVNWTLIANGHNLGFAAGCNQGIRASRGSRILLLNNDVVVTPEWLEGLLECLELTPESGIAGPMTNNISGIQKIPNHPYTDLSGLDTFAVEFREHNRHRRIPHRRIVGFCMLFRRELVDEIGLLDESFGSGNFEDDDFCLRTALAGYQNVIAGDVFIHHVGSASFRGNNINFAASMTGNCKLFLEKWSRPLTDENESKKVVTLKTLEKADIFHQRGEHEKMIDTILQEGIRHVPEEKRFYYALAEYLLDVGRSKDARDTLYELGALPQEDKGYVLLSRALAGMNYLDEAYSLAEKALTLTPRHGSALHLLGAIALCRGDAEQAFRFWENAIEADPGSGKSYTGLGLVAHQKGNDSHALDLFEKGFLLSPLFSASAIMYHTAVCESGEFLRGEKLFSEMHRFYPQQRRIHYLLIDLLIRQGKTEKALKEIEAACATFGMEDGMLSAGLELRHALGPMTINAEKQMQGTSVSLCMIIKDEENNLPRCLNSLKPIVDEIIIVDTGSRDRSIEVAELFGARIFEHPWTGDFSAARNISLEHASGDWILVMDADEVISPLDYDKFRKIVADHTKKAYLIETRNYSTKVIMENWRPNDGSYPSEEAGAGWTPSSKIRLFPKRRDIRFEGSIHELVTRTTEAAGIPILAAPIPVHHYGYLDLERQKRKEDDYYLMGKKKLAESGENDFTALCELAIQAGSTGRYEEAVELWGRVLTIKPSYPLAYFNLGFVLMQMGKFHESRNASAKAIELQSEHVDAVINYAMCDICLDGAEKALAMLAKNLDVKPGHFYSKLMLAISQICVDKKEEGLVSLGALKKDGIAFEGFLNDFAIKLIRAKKIVYGRRVLEAAISSGNCNEETVALVQSLGEERFVA